MWLLPAAVAVLFAIPVLIAVRRTTGEALHLRRSLVQFSDLRPALVELRTDTRALRTSAISKLDRR